MGGGVGGTINGTMIAIGIVMIKNGAAVTTSAIITTRTMTVIMIMIGIITRR